MPIRIACPTHGAEPAPSHGPALGADTTRAGLRRHVRRALGAVTAGLVTAIAGGFVMQLMAGHPEHDGLVAGLAMSPLRGTDRGFTPNGQPTLVLIDDVRDRQFVLSVVSINSRWRTLDAYNGRQIWFAGDPTRRGVVAPPGGSFLLLARRPRLAIAKDCFAAKR